MVQYYSRDYDVKCQLDTCKTYPVITDDEKGELVCGGCGLVLVENMPDDSYESHGYTQEEFMTQTRTGPSTTLTMHDRGLSTVIGKDKDSTGKSLSSKTKFEFRRLRTWDQRSKSRSTASLSKAFTHLNSMKTKLGIPDSVIESAAYIYRKAVAEKMTRGRTMASLVSAALYAACRENGIPRTLDDIAEAGNTERRVLSRDIRTIIKRLGLTLNQYDITSFVSKISNNLKLKEKTKRDAYSILDRCKKEKISAGKHPVAQAAAALYVACILNGEKMSQRKLANVSGVSDVTIRNRVTLIRKTLQLE
ncbi:MAG: transcription initiation factor TFIIIB [Nitrosopumilaceae archaeon]|nr:transcription initiation factor TFIIIB [Nitrosopumilaceae archaeon]NIU00902.1 transcription initiation factor TFIIIB [Nitrosopumilaceae archaeon]NIU87355.1 transcription initiation factor TFIIIB [Nitrosopumilaceae archaeon]NIV65883.1 transcription initiation factor TFIIIB [Nitrosopumilaceae archaeon]NIX61504.1 transcription initiation factor TFIIIB [Nitrosopumilaceae archaeon]